MFSYKLEFQLRTRWFCHGSSAGQSPAQKALLGNQSRTTGNERQASTKTALGCCSRCLNHCPWGWPCFISLAVYYGHEPELLTFVLASLRGAKEKESALCQVWLLASFWRSKMGGELQDKAETVELIQQLQQAGAVWVGRTESLDETISPRGPISIRFQRATLQKYSPGYSYSPKQRHPNPIWRSKYWTFSLMKETENQKKTSTYTARLLSKTLKILILILLHHLVQHWS